MVVCFHALPKVIWHASRVDGIVQMYVRRLSGDHCGRSDASMSETFDGVRTFFAMRLC